MILYYTSPHIEFRKKLTENVFTCVLGDGSNRKTYEFEKDYVLDFLLSFKGGLDKENLISQLNLNYDVSKIDAKNIIDYLISEKIIVNNNNISKSESFWEKNGWRDALDFHKATRNLQFNQDTKVYLDAMKKQLDIAIEVESEAQPKSLKYHDACLKIISLPKPERNNKSNLKEVISNSRPFRSYKDKVIDIVQLSNILGHTYGVKTEHNGLLGHYIKKTCPSGGSRHPLEVYLCVNKNESSVLSKGIYHYLPKDHSLEFLIEGDFSKELTEYCFEKPGIETASIVIFLTSRWYRHMWKYRYARSYRMVLLEIGHFIQNNILVATENDVQCFLCPSFHDTKCLKLLGLEDDLSEGVMYVIGMGIQKSLNEHDYFFPLHQY